MMEQKIDFSGIVVTYNDAKLLGGCLKSLSFCAQLVVIDLGSNDRSVQIAKQHGAELVFHEWSPIVEPIRKDAIEFAVYDWIIQLDPDERFPSDAVDDLRSIIRMDSKLGVIHIPWQFYFKRKPLKTTIWGIENTKGVVLHKARNNFTALSHRGTKLLNGFNSVTLPWKSGYIIRHYWIDSYKDLFKKHWRYIREEGEARYKNGERFSLVRCIKDTLYALKNNLIEFKGLYGGFKGIFLSLFYTWYIFMSQLSLYFYEHRSISNDFLDQKNIQ